MKTSLSHSHCAKLGQSRWHGSFTHRFVVIGTQQVHLQISPSSAPIHLHSHCVSPLHPLLRPMITNRSEKEPCQRLYQNFTQWECQRKRAEWEREAGGRRVFLKRECLQFVRQWSARSLPISMPKVALLAKLHSCGSENRITSIAQNQSIRYLWLVNYTFV